VLILKDIPSIIPENFSPVKVIFQNYQNEKYDNSSLYRDILEYSNLPIVTSGFRFTELGRWLMKKNKEFINYYSDSNAKTSISTRIANKRQRIQNCIDNLEKWDILLISKMVTAERNETKTPLYIATPLGKLVWLIVETKFSNQEKKNNAIKEIIGTVNSIKEHNDSAIVLFITELLNHLWENNKTSSIIQYFERILTLELNSGHDFLSYLLGIKYFKYWFIMDEELSFKILEKLPADKRKIILMNLKTEIEYYYQQNYLINYNVRNKFYPIPMNNLNYGDLNKSGTVPYAYWENTRAKFIGTFTKVVIPFYCNGCNSHRASVVDIKDYLKTIIITDDIIPPNPINGNCLECGKRFAIYSIFNWVTRIQK